jgi:branched-subunit amino acid ABC-type transport system permease component
VTLSLFVQLVLNGLMMGGIYALVASGFTLVLGVIKIFNFAQGQFYMLGAFVTYGLAVALHVPYLLAILGAVVAMGLLGVVLHFGIIKWTIPFGFFHTMLVTVALGTIISQLSLVLIGDDTKVMSHVVPGNLNIGTVALNNNKMLLVVGALVVMGALYYFMKTRLGTAMLAASENREVAGLQGINTNRIFWAALAVSGGLCAVAGALVTPVLSVSTGMGTLIFAKAMMVVLVGGSGSMSGALLAAFVVGIAESFTYQFFGQLNLVIMFALIGILIFFRPGGLLGRPLPIEERQDMTGPRVVPPPIPGTVRAILAAVLIAVLVVLPFLVNGYVLQVVIFTITAAMLGLAFSFTFKVGLPRFDAGAWWGVGAYTTAMLMWKVGMSFWLTIPIAGLVCVALGYVVFKVAVPRGMMVFLMFGMVVSLAIQQVFGSVGFFGGWGGTNVVSPPSAFGFQFAQKSSLYFLGLGFLACNLLVFYLLYHSKIGRAWKAIGASPRLGSSLGIDVVKYRLANVLISNFFLGVAGSYFVAYSRAVVPTSFGLAASVTVMMYVFIGGFGHSFAGPIIGALVVTFIPEVLRLADKYESVFSGAITIAIIVLAPMGLVGLLDIVRVRRGRVFSGRRGRVPERIAELVNSGSDEGAR